MLVELVVATLVLAVGVLAVAGTAAAVERMIASGRRTGNAASVAASRFELILTEGCAGAADGQVVSDRYQEAWAVSRVGGLLTISLTVSYADGRGTRGDGFEAASWCP